MTLILSHINMDHVRQIQEIVDEHKEEMPTGVVTDVMEQCQEAYDALPNLWKVTYVKTSAPVKNHVNLRLHTVLIEEAPIEEFHSSIHGILWRDVFQISKIPPVEHHVSLKGVCFHDWDSNGIAYIITKVERYGKRNEKRAREEEEQ